VLQLQSETLMQFSRLAGCKPENLYHAATLDEMRNWLRTEFNLIVEACVTDEGLWYEDVFYNPLTNKKFAYLSKSEGLYMSHDSALERAITVALKSLQV